jgi:hypothetical protein
VGQPKKTAAKKTASALSIYYRPILTRCERPLWPLHTKGASA